MKQKIVDKILTTKRQLYLPTPPEILMISPPPPPADEFFICPICGEPTHESHMVQARFDYEVSICATCSNDGN